MSFDLCSHPRSISVDNPKATLREHIPLSSWSRVKGRLEWLATEGSKSLSRSISRRPREDHDIWARSADLPMAEGFGPDINSCVRKPSCEGPATATFGTSD
jgi:hypothetical protein